MNIEFHSLLKVPCHESICIGYTIPMIFSLRFKKMVQRLLVTFTKLFFSSTVLKSNEGNSWITHFFLRQDNSKIKNVTSFV